jgi:hypothetical protein
MNEIFMAYDRWGGLITMLCGAYATLLAYGYLPRKPKDPEKLQQLRLPRFDGHGLGHKKGSNHEQGQQSRGNAPAV